LNKKIIIIRAGLSGLLIAYRLLNKGFDIEIIEARNRVGGRIHTIKSGKATIEMGATWFTKVHHNLSALLEEFEVGYFEQFIKGKSFYETLFETPAQIIEIPEKNPSYRVSGGTFQLLEKIKKELNEVKFHLNEMVTTIDFTNEKASVVTNKKTFSSDIVISTIPQQLLVTNTIFLPKLPEQLINIGAKTHTWMQDSIKVALVYANPFWRTKNLSGTLFSTIGPVSEFYDHSNYNVDGFALCGFINAEMAMYSKKDRKNKILLHLEKIFGKDALDFIDYQETIWSEEEFTKNTKQNNFVFPHQNNGHPIFRESYYNNRLFLSGSETALQYPGYMEGAILSANEVVSRILNL